MTLKNVIRNFTVVTAIALAGASTAATDLTVYTAVEAEELNNFANQFNAEYPDIRINWIRDSTGIITAKLLAEKNNPQADAIWGLAATSLLAMKNEQMLQPYSPAGVDKLDAKYIDTDGTPSWVGMRAWIASVCYNTIEAKKYNLPKPASWEDLTRPIYQNHIIMPNPGSSGTGFLDVSSWLQMFGEQQGWNYMDRLHTNISRYTHSGSKPCKLAAAGETAIGISFAYKGAQLIKKGAPLELAFPKEGLGWDLEAAAIVKGTQQLTAAQKLMDFAVSHKANQMYNEGFAVVAMPGIAKPVDHYPNNAQELMIDNSFVWAANNRDQILKNWQKRYDSKSDTK